MRQCIGDEAVSVSVRIAVAQLGARRNYAIPAILESAGLLECFYTDLCANVWPLRLISRVCPSWSQPAGLKRLLARHVDRVPGAKIRCFPRFALQRIFRGRYATSPAGLLRSWLRANQEFGRLVTQRGFGDANTVYAFNGAALEMFRCAKDRGMRTILEQTDAPVAIEERLLQEERQRWPGWEYEGAQPEDWTPMADREVAEWRLADTIVCGSEYVREGIQAEAGPTQRCAVVPYGVKAGFFRSAPRTRKHRELRVLFVGTVCLRKGIPYLLEAAKQLKSERIVFRVVGPVRVADHAVKELERYLELVGPVPRSTVAREYEWADVFVMPSISEGSANVCYEALAAGLPVITTPNAGSVVRDGQDGYIVPIRSAESLAQRIRLLVADRNLLQHFGENATARARNFTWDHYAKRLLSTICSSSCPSRLASQVAS